MTTDLMSYLRRYRPGLTREEAAVAAEISIATLTRRLRDGLDADEIIKAARSVGASPVEALLELGLLAHPDVRAVATVDALSDIDERVLLEELLARAVAREGETATDREEAGLTPSPARRFDLVHPPTDVEVEVAFEPGQLAARQGDHDD